MSDLAIVQRLIALGLKGKQLAGVIAIIEERLSAVEQADERRRLKQRERKARSRDNDVTVTGQSRGQVCDSHSDTPPPKERSPIPPKEITPSSRPPSEMLIPNVAPSPSSGASRLELVSDEEAGEQAAIPAILDRRSYPESFEALWAEYRPIASPNSTKSDAHRAWAKLSPVEREHCWTGLVRYAVWVGEENARRAAAKRAPVEVKHLATFINRRGWEPFLEDVA